MRFPVREDEQSAPLVGICPQKQKRSLLREAWALNKREKSACIRELPQEYQEQFVIWLKETWKSPGRNFGQHF